MRLGSGVGDQLSSRVQRRLRNEDFSKDCMHRYSGHTHTHTGGQIGPQIEYNQSRINGAGNVDQPNKSGYSLLSRQSR